MRAGTLRHLLTFQKKTVDNSNSFKEARETSTTDFQVMGKFLPLGSREFPTGWKRYEETTAAFVIRYRPGIDAALHQIVFTFDPQASPVQSSLWDIRPPYSKDGRPFELFIEAVEVK